MKSIKYKVVFEPFAERHFIRTFAKKYKNAWEFILSAITQEFEKIDILFLKSIAEYIPDKKADVMIAKTEFKISGIQESRHGSGNRCIVAINKKLNTVCVLVVYHKNDLGEGNETANWKRIVKENYPEYSKLLTNL